MTMPANLNEHVRKWIDECAALCQPEKLFWCNGSEAERRALKSARASSAPRD